MLTRSLVNGLFIIIIFAIWLVPVEWGLRWYFHEKGNPVEQVMPILRPDKKLIWRQKENVKKYLWKQEIRLNSAGFRSDELEQADVIVLGPSSAFGWGVAVTENYSSRLSRLTNKKILNASQIGFSSEQGVQLIQDEKINLFRPKHIIIAYGVNDLDRFRFFGQNGKTDYEFFQEGLPGLESEFWTQFALHSALQKIVGALSTQLDCRRLRYPARRVENAKRLQNFQIILDWAKAKGAKVTIIGTPFGGKERPKDGTSANANEDYYRRSEHLAMEHKCQEAWAEFQKARGLETERIAWEIEEMNSSLKNWASQKRIDFIDAAALLDQKNDFVDPIHPSATGHKKIAEAIRLRILASSGKSH